MYVGRNVGLVEASPRAFLALRPLQSPGRINDANEHDDAVSFARCRTARSFFGSVDDGGQFFPDHQELMAVANVRRIGPSPCSSSYCDGEGSSASWHRPVRRLGSSLPGERTRSGEEARGVTANRARRYTGRKISDGKHRPGPRCGMIGLRWWLGSSTQRCIPPRARQWRQVPMGYGRRLVCHWVHFHTLQGGNLTLYLERGSV